MDDLTQVLLGWLLTWCNCPERGLNSAQRAQARSAREAASERAGVLSQVTKEDLAAGLDRALRGLPELCPDVPEERRLRMVAHLARVLEGGHFPPGVMDSPPPTYQVPLAAAPVDGGAGEGSPVPPEIG